MTYRGSSGVGPCQSFRHIPHTLGLKPPSSQLQEDIERFEEEIENLMQPDTTAFPLRGREHEPIGRESGTGASGRAAINDPKEKVEEALDDVNQPIRLLGEVALFNFGDDNGDDDDEENLELEGNNGLEAIPEFLRLPIRLFGNWVTTFPILARLFLVSSVVAIGLGVLSLVID